MNRHQRRQRDRAIKAAGGDTAKARRTRALADAQEHSRENLRGAVAGWAALTAATRVDGATVTRVETVNSLGQPIEVLIQATIRPRTGAHQ